MAAERSTGVATAVGGGDRRSSSKRKETTYWRDWSDLPLPALLSISQSLTSLVDFFAFGGVCWQWRSVAKASKLAFMESLPPLLCRVSDLHFYPITGRGFHRKKRSLRKKGKRKGQIYKEIRRRDGHPIAFSCGYLIMGNFTSLLNVWLLNPLTGAEFHNFPPLPLPNYSSKEAVLLAVLLAPPTSPDCVLLISNEQNFLKFCHPGDTEWTVITGSSQYGHINDLIVFRGSFYALTFEGKCVAFNLRSYSEVTVLPGTPYFRTFCSRLCVSDGELLEIFTVLGVEFCGRWIYDKVVGFSVHQFDFLKSEWLELKNLGGKAIIVDFMGKAFSFDPAKWQGCGNCIYFYDLLSDPLSICVFHMEDGRIEDLTTSIPFSDKSASWHSAVWLPPHLCFHDPRC